MRSQRLIELIRSGDNEAALLAAVLPPEIFRSKTLSKLERVLPTFFNDRKASKDQAQRIQTWKQEFLRLAVTFEAGSTRALIDHYFSFYGAESHPGGNYFSYRFGTPKHLVSLSLLEPSRPAEGASIDIGCGAGTMVRYLENRSAGQPVIGTDINFFLLWLAKTRVAQGSHFVCCDASQGLPLATSSVNTVLLSNWFHVLYAKGVAASEIERIATDDAFIVISSVRHKDYRVQTPNRALLPNAYGQLFSRQNILIRDQGVLNNYLEGRGPDLTPKTDEKLSETPMISIIVSNGKDVLRQHEKMVVPPHTVGQLSVNPIYSQEQTANGMVLSLNWPSAQYRQDNAPMGEYLPETLEITAEGSQSLADNKLTEELLPLARAGIISDIPEHY